MNHHNLENFDHSHQFSQSDDDNYENDDLVTFQLDSKTINLYYSQLTKYSKHIRDGYLFSDVLNRFSQEIKKFQAEYDLPTKNLILFFKLLQQNYNIKDNLTLTYDECTDLLKISKYLDIRKLTYQVNEYIKRHNIDVDFIIQMIQYEMKTNKKSDTQEIEINADLENFLSNKLDECLVNEKFGELPISIIYRIIEKSSNRSDKSDKLFDLIKKSITKFCILLSFIDLQELSEKRIEELIELYSIDENQKYFRYMKFDLNYVKRMRNEKKNLHERLISTENINQEQQNKMSELEAKIKQLQNELNKSEKAKNKIELEKNQIAKQLNDSEREKNKIELEKNQITKQLNDSEKIKSELQKKLEDFLIKGQIVANVKRDLLINAQIYLTINRGLLDTKKSKYIITTNNSKTLGNEAYERGEPITSLIMPTVDFLCKSGTYYVRCIVFDQNGNSVELVSNPVTTNGRSVSFKYKGKPEKLLIIEGQYKLEVWGAQGGDSTGKRESTSLPVNGGLGGYSKGILSLKKCETIHIYVGGEGKPANSKSGATTKGGFPDGGDTKTGHIDGCFTVPGTGGGSTSIRINDDSDYSRVIVAGGGGGASSDRSYTNPGGFGGGSTGGNCYYYETLREQGAGTQTGSSCGLGADIKGDPGRFGHGATNKYKQRCNSGGGGGGGWYGGGSGGYGYPNDCSSGGGGSGWTFTEFNFNTWQSGDSSNSSKFYLSKSYYLTDALSVSGDKEFPRPDGNGTEQGHSGNGYAKITPQ